MCPLFAQQHNLCDNVFLLLCPMGKRLSVVYLLIIPKAMKAIYPSYLSGS